MELRRAPQAANAAPPGLPARRAAIAVLSAVLRRRVPLDAAADEVLAKARLDPRDAGFARAIVFETMRRYGQLDAVIRSFVAKPPPEHKAGTALEILLAGACELLFLGVAPHAAVDAANRLAQDDDRTVHFKPLINAVLRRVSREGEAVLAAQDAERVNAPDWLWARWVAHFGEAEARAIARAHLVKPPLDLVLKSDAVARVPDGERIAPGIVRLTDAGAVDTLPGYDSGHWWVQDFAASLPARLFGDVAGKRAIDLCAAPGGKTLQLAAAGAQVTAVDISGERLKRVAENLARLKLKADLVQADARDYEPDAPAPFVLLDAPCTATGTIRRHPDIAWLKSAADIGVLTPLQADLLDAAAAMTAPGGTLIYAVCSLEPEEGEEQVASFLARNGNFTLDPVRADDVPDAQLVTPGGCLRTLPSYWRDKGGMDGFFAARLKRRI